MSKAEGLTGFPVVTGYAVRWGDMDAFQHVNNIVYFQYFETARICYFERMGFVEAQKLGPILAATSCRFKAPLRYPDTVQLGARVAEVKKDSFVMQHAVLSEKSGRVVAEGDALIVPYHYGERRRAEMPQLWRDRISAIEGSADSAADGF